MARILLGSATTNNLGVATLNYTGVGIGKLDVIAVTTIDGETVSSEKIDFCDCLFYDGAVNGNKNDNWTVGSAITKTAPFSEAVT